MFVIQARNVNDAFASGMQLLRHEGQIQHSRAGEVLVVPAPVTTVYRDPCDRVLFEPVRNANPFFHLFEALWMLDGRRDARWLDQFVHDFSSRFADEDGQQHGAYGFRWVRHFDVEGGGAQPRLPDQLETIIRMLKDNPNDRRAVLTMWDPVADLAVDSKDVPCNTHVYFRVRSKEGPFRAVLDMTVCCRSNDIVWGAYGANAVHFSFLQEYIAARLPCGVGTYYQLSNNFHAYTSVLEQQTGVPAYEGFYDLGGVAAQPLTTVPEAFRRELRYFLNEAGVMEQQPHVQFYANPFFREVAWPMLWAHKMFRLKSFPEALEALRLMPEKSDWGLAARKWIERRVSKKRSA